VKHLPALGKVSLKGCSLNLKNVLREIPLRFYSQTEDSKPKNQAASIMKLREDRRLYISTSESFILKRIT
jgi:hypothetical protein